jgi:diaminopimelate decarboxylase
MGIDIVSPGELYTAVHAGFPMERAYFHGNNKTDADVAFAIDSGIGYFVCDNIEELRAIDREAAERGMKQKILLRITPGIDPHTLAKINTGRVDSKFGAAIETGQAEQITGLALGFENIELRGFHCHIGSQIFEFEPFCDAARIMLTFVAKMRDRFGFETVELNLGGGMGVPYLPDQPRIDYAANIAAIGDIVDSLCTELSLKKPTILMEPGRSIVADSGITLYTVGTLKEIPGFKTYVSVDGGMADNPRFALYESPYTVILANRANEDADCVCTVAGRCCESGDLIQEGVSLPRPNRGDTVAVLTTGAYNYAMASNYNRLPRPPIVMLDGERDYVAVRRETYADLMNYDI